MMVMAIAAGATASVAKVAKWWAHGRLGNGNGSRVAAKVRVPWASAITIGTAARTVVAAAVGTHNDGGRPGAQPLVPFVPPSRAAGRR